jgi:hypothetical protein
MKLETLIQQIVTHFNTTPSYLDGGRRLPVLLSYSCRTIVEQSVATLDLVFELIRQLSYVSTPVVIEGGNYDQWLKPLCIALADSLEAYITSSYPKVASDNYARLSSM